MNYKSWDDEELRRVLIADPDDTAAICEAAERFAKLEDLPEKLTVALDCPHCFNSIEHEVFTEDYLS